MCFGIKPLNRNQLFPQFIVNNQGRHQQKIKVLIRALPELNPPTPPPNSGTLVLFSGRQKRRFARMMEKDTDDDNNRCHDNFDKEIDNFDDNNDKNY